MDHRILEENKQYGKENRPDSRGESGNSKDRRGKKYILRVIQDDLVSTKHEQDVK